MNHHPPVMALNDNDEYARTLWPETRHALEMLYSDRPKVMQALEAVESFNLNAAAPAPRASQPMHDDAASQLHAPLQTILNVMRDERAQLLRKLIRTPQHTTPEQLAHETELKEAITLLCSNGAELFEQLGYRHAAKEMREAIPLDLPRTLSRG